MGYPNIFSFNGVRLESPEDPLESLVTWAKEIQEGYKVALIGEEAIRAAWGQGSSLNLENHSATVVSSLNVFCGEEGGVRILSARLTRFGGYWEEAAGRLWFERWRAVREAAELLKLKGLEIKEPSEFDIRQVRLRSPRWLPGPTEVQVGDWIYPAWGEDWDRVREMKETEYSRRGSYLFRRITRLDRKFWSKVLRGEDVEFPPAPEPRKSRWAKNLEEVLEVEGRCPHSNLFGVIVHQNLVALETMLEWKAKADEPFADGRTPLWAALERGWIDGAMLLLSRGASLEVVNSAGLVLHKTVPKHHLSALLERVAEEGSEELQRRVFAVVGHRLLSRL